MSTQVLHSAPRWADVAREQFRAVGIAIRREAALAALLVIGLSVVMLVAVFRERARGNVSGDMNLSPGMFLPFVLLGFLAPLGVWKNEEPSRRFYHWCMPASRGMHTLTKNAAGWSWYMIAGLAYLLWGALLVLILGGTPADGSAEAWQWVQPFTAATVAFLLASILVISSDHPWRWAAGILVGFTILSLVAEATQLHGVKHILETVWNGRLGLGTALSGEVGTPEQFTLPNGRVIMAVQDRPDFAAWLSATLAWLGIGSAGVVAAAYRHQER